MTADAPTSLRLAPEPSSVRDLLHDESKLAANAVASVALPASADALREVLRWHADRGHAISVSGARTGVTGGAVPQDGEHVITLHALRGVLAVDGDTERPSATVLAGTSLAELTASLEASHPALSFPVDPTERSASLGGMVATNAGGARSYRYGAMRDWVEALTVELVSGRTLTLRRGDAANARGEFILTDGDDRAIRILPIPKPRTKNAIGYGFDERGDPLDLFIGAEGTLGVVSEVTVRLAWQREGRLGFLQFFDAPARAFRFVDALRAEAGLRTTAIEFLDARSHALARESGKAAVDRVLSVAPDGSCSVFAEIGYADDEALAHAGERLDALATELGGDPRASLAGVSEAELRDIRTFRHAVPERANAIIARRREEHPGLHKIATDMAVTNVDLAWVHALFSKRLTDAGLDFAVFGHAGDNHFHVNILPRDERELTRAKLVYADLARDVVARGGSVAAEHGIGRIKTAFLATQYPASVLENMRAIKRWLDPDLRLNRGVLLDL